MNRSFRCTINKRVMVLALALALAGLSARAVAAVGGKNVPDERRVVRVLMFVGGQAHDYKTLPTKLAQALGKDGELDVRVTADLSELNAETLKSCDVMLFHTCDDCAKLGLSPAQQRMIVDALGQGKGLVALHCALWSFKDWPEWRKIIGGRLNNHDKYGPYDFAVVHRHHPIAAGLPSRFTLTDEVYYVDQRRPDMQVIVQTANVHGQRSGPDPQAWTVRYRGGRVFTTTFGHDGKAQTDPAFLKLLGNGIRWAAGRLGPATTLSESERREGFKPLCDGKTLNGWRYDPVYWKIEKGIIIANSHPKGLEKNSFAITEALFGDFVLRFSIKLVNGNSGAQFRSQALEHFEVAGYQADVVPGGWGNLHEQNGRGRLVEGWKGKANRAVNVNDWTEMEVVARGRHIVIRVNGVMTADWTEPDASRPTSGIVALQLHRGDPMEVRFANIRIKRLDQKTPDHK